MNEFVNYNKRDITLPTGCKDLNDALILLQQEQVEKALERGEGAAVLRDGTILGKLSEIEGYVEMVFASRGNFHLTMNRKSANFSVNVHRMEDFPISASALVPGGSNQEVAVRDYFVRRGLKTPTDSSMPPSFLPGVPTSLTYEISPMPSDRGELSALLSDLFKEVDEASGDSELIFSCFEYGRFEDWQRRNKIS